MIRNQKIKGIFIAFILGPLFFKWIGVFQSLLDCLYLARYFLNGQGYFSLCQIVFQLQYEQLSKIYTSSSYLMFVCWFPFFTIFKCSNLQSHYNFFQASQAEESFPKILISRHLKQQKRTLWHYILKKSPTQTFYNLVLKNPLCPRSDLQ